MQRGTAISALDQALRVLRANACGAEDSDLGRSIEAEYEVRIGPVQQSKPKTFVFTLVHAVSLRGGHAD